MPQQQGVMSTYQLTAHNHRGVGQGGLIDPSVVNHNALLNYVGAEHLSLPNTNANVLTDHNKVAHDALLIDADLVDGEHANAITTNARVKAHFPDTIANVLSDHNKVAHDALNIDADLVDGEHANAITTNARVKAHFPDTIANILSNHNLANHAWVDQNVLQASAVTFGGAVINGKLTLGTPTELTIAGGAITVTRSYHKVDTQGEAPADDLVTINGGTDGMLLILRTVAQTRDVTIKDTGNIKLRSATRVMGLNHYVAAMIYDSGLSKWIELGEWP